MNSAADQVRVTAAPHPLRAATVDLEMPQGRTLRQILETVQPDPILLRNAHVEIDGLPIPRDRWHLVRPKAGRLVTVRVLPMGGAKNIVGGGGGGKNPIQTVLTIAIVAGAIAISAGALGFIGLAAGSFGAWATAAVVGGVGLALMPSPQVGNIKSTSGVRDVRDSPTQFIEGARNTADLWGRVPDLLGRHKMVPRYGAKPFTMATGSRQYLNLMFVWTTGSVVISDLKIGETPISDFENVTVVTKTGEPEDTPISIYSRDVDEEAFAITLKQPASFTFRTTPPDADVISIDLTWQRGLTAFNDQGGRIPTSVDIRIQYRELGASTWLAPVFTDLSDGATTVPDSWVTYVSDEARIIVTGKTTSAVRHGFLWRTPSRGQYEVAVRRASADSTSSKIFNEVTWTALRRYKIDDPIILPAPLARTALRIRATDQLNNIIDTFNGVVSRRALDWTGSTWALRETQNPASMFRHVLQGPSNARPVPSSQIDLEMLQEWHEFCDAKGYECNLVVDFPSSVREILRTVAATGQASLDNVDGKWSVVIDRPRSVPVQFFTPRNSSKFRAEKLWTDRAHAWRLRFNDEAHDWRSGERIIYADGFNAGNSTKYEQHDIIGVTSALQAQRLALHKKRSEVLQPEVWTIDVDFEHLVARRGDLVKVAHDVLLVGLATGRIKSVNVTGSQIISVVVDEACTFETGKSYGLSVRTLDNAAYTAALATHAAGEHTTLTFATPLPSGAVDPGDLFGFGEFGSETVDAQVRNIRRSGDLGAHLTLLPYSSDLFNTRVDADFDPGMTELFTVPAPAIQTVYSGQSALAREPDATLVRTVVEVKPLKGNRADGYLEAQVRPSDTGEPFVGAAVISRPASNIIVLGGLNIGEYWDIRVRWVVGALLPGRWTTRANVYIEGVTDLSTEPGTLGNLTLSALGNQALLRWDPPAAIDIRSSTIVFRHSPFQVGATWANATSIGRGVPARNQTANLPLKGGTYLARIVTAAGLQGPVAAVPTKQHSVNTFNLLLSFSEDPIWGGSHTNTEISPEGSLRMSGVFTPGVGGFGDLGDVAISGVYDFSVVVDLLTIRKVRVSAYVDAASEALDDLIDSREDLIDNWGDFDGGADQAVADAQVWMRITDDVPGEATDAWSDATGWSDGTGWSDLSGGEGDPVWKAYHRLDAAEVEARGFDFQIRMASRDPAYNILVSQLRIDFEELA